MGDEEGGGEGGGEEGMLVDLISADEVNDFVLVQ